MNFSFRPMTFLRNLKWAFFRNGVEERLALERRVQNLERQMLTLRTNRVAFRDLLMLEEIANTTDARFQDEAGFCRRHGRLEVFPYEKKREFPSVEVFHDSEKGLQYVLHGGKKLYYPVEWGKGSIAFSYTNAIAIEGLLGDGCLEKSPHNYLDSRFPVKDGALVCDLGAAEGLLGLHFAERASRIVVGECDEKWLEPLKATFEPWREKVDFILQPLGMGNESDMALSALLERITGGKKDMPIFLKFDIEGAERFAIQKMENIFRTHSDVTVACAAYHRQDDGTFLEVIFKEWGYQTAYSNGAMLFLLDNQTPPYFRRGILFAKNW